MTKSTKSHQRERSPLFENSSPVSATPTNALRALVHSPRARVSRASHACQVRAAQNKAKAGDFAAPTVSAIPRVRTYHTRKPSRFVHALYARQLKVQGGRESNACADGTIKINLIPLCSHTDAHPNLNREVCHSLTWHSSKSESALERFEPVAAAMLWSDGQGTLFAPVAARRQKVFKRGILSSF